MVIDSRPPASLVRWHQLSQAPGACQRSADTREGRISDVLGANALCDMYRAGFRKQTEY